MNAANESSESRIWKCPECGHVEEIDQDWLADHGEPVCSECDWIWKFNPKTEEYRNVSIPRENDY